MARKGELKDYNGFLMIRRGLFAHIEAGLMKGRDIPTYVAIHFFADYDTGVAYNVSAPYLANFLHERPDRIRRSLRRLERVGYIKRFEKRGGEPGYDIVIDKYLVKKCISIDAAKSNSINEIAFIVKENCTLSVNRVYIECTSSVHRALPIKDIKILRVVDTKSSRGKKPPSSKVPKEFSTDSTEYKLAKLLFDTIRQRKPDFKEKNLHTWAVHIDKMIRLDGRKPDRITEVIRWCQADSGDGSGWSGWQNNILCTETLRKQFDKLELAMRKAKAPTVVAPLKRNSGGRTPREIALEQAK